MSRIQQNILLVRSRITPERLGPYHHCRWSGPARYQAISRHGTGLMRYVDLFLPRWSHMRQRYVGICLQNENSFVSPKRDQHLNRIIISFDVKMALAADDDNPNPLQQTGLVWNLKMKYWIVSLLTICKHTSRLYSDCEYATSRSRSNVFLIITGNVRHNEYLVLRF